MVEAVIVVPGIMGSELFKGPTLVWPGSPTELFLRYSKMKELLDPDLAVGEIIGSVSISNQYDSLLDDIERCGFNRGGPKPTLRTCPYDWRKDNRLAAARLADEVKRLRADHGSDLQVTIVAHSMGGLVSRYLLESGDFDEQNTPGFAAIRRLITVGTPHRGAPLALAAALGQVKRLFLSAAQVQQVANNDAFPSVYQLLPPPGDPFLWNTDPAVRLDPVSPHEPDVAKLLGLSKANLASAAEFARKLDVSRRPAGVSYFCFVGTRQGTINNIQVNFAQQSPDPRSVLLADGGDGTVPSFSASLPGVQQLAVGGDHGTLYKTPEVLQTLGALLGKPGALSSLLTPNRVRISVRDEVVPPGARVPVVLFFRVARAQFAGELVVVKHTSSKGQPLPAPTPVDKLAISYQGAPIDSLGLTLLAPPDAGAYTLDLLDAAGTSIAEAPPWLMIQQN